MEKPNGIGNSEGTPNPGPTPPTSPPPSSAETGPLIGTNSWARNTILSRAQRTGLSPELARQVGSVALWYYNRMVLRLNRKVATDQELPPSTNRYLVPIALAMACEYKQHPVELVWLLRLSGTPTEKTIETAQKLYARYSQMLTPVSKAAPPAKGARPGPALRPSVDPKGAPPSDRPFKPTAAGRPAVGARPRSPAGRPIPSGTRVAAATALAVPAAEIAGLRRLFTPSTPPLSGPKPAGRPRQQNTNAWARKRIADLCRSLGLPENVRHRSLVLYEKIIDLHSAKGHVPAGKRLQLSPRLNWSLVYTTIYLGCRFEEYPKDLRDILGRNPHQGSMREIYRLYRFYKRELKLEINLVDVRTFILSWFDGFELSELLYEKATAGESEWVKNRAIAIANQARGDKSLRRTSTKMIAAGAFTTALAERNPPGNRYAFYKAIAGFLHMSEETIRFIVARIAELL